MPAEKLPQIAVVGCGYWGRNHIRTLAGLGALAGVCDHNRDFVEQIAAEHGTIARDFDVLLADPAVDGLVLALPADQHAPLGLQAIGAGKHVLIEKPMALTADDAEHLVAAAQARGTVLMTGHILRFHKAFQAVMAIIQSGTLGTVRHVQSNRLAFGKFHQRFDALWDLGPHDLSLVLAVTGRAPETIHASLTHLGGSQADAAHVHMRFSDGVSGHIHVSRHSPWPERRFMVVGSEAMVVWDDHADWPQKVAVFRHTIARGAGDTRFDLGEPDYHRIEPGQALTDELSHFLDCIEAGRVPLTSGRQGADVIAILEAASRQAR